jgi:cytochrome c oxidase cbb3-type subunit 1
MSATATIGRPVSYNDDVVRKFIIAAVFWAIVAFAVGVYIASELAWPQLNFGEAWLNFGRLRPVHTSAAIFAFGGSALLGTSFYVVQRTCRARLFGGRAFADFVFWGYQFFIVMAALSYVMGFSKGREYAEPEWHIDLWLTIVWVCYAVIFIGTLMKRVEPHIYVANWFYLAFILTIAVLHIGNNLTVPVSVFGAKSYSLFSGTQDALIQWWYGHNAVGFFLTAGFLGMMYYFIPKAANRPVYSYRLSIVHFWSLIFIYIWAGPHHLHWTALPDWAQTLGMAFSIMLWMPSWGGMINGIMTLSGAWDKLRTDPGLRFSVTAVAFYGMATFEGPVMSVRTVNALSHYTDWGIGHVHSGSLGWVAFISFGAIYRDARHRFLYFLDVGCRHHGRADVARLRQPGFPAIFVHRKRGGGASVLHHTHAGRRDVPDRRTADGLQPDHDGAQPAHRGSPSLASGHHAPAGGVEHHAVQP